MTRANLIKTAGYLVSGISVLLLAFVAWRMASHEPLLAACLIGGVVTSIAGMAMRWISYQMDQE